MGGFMSIAPFIIVAAVMYMLLIRPQAKQQKKHQSFVGSLKKGDDVITQGGIIGRVWMVEDRVVTVDVGGGTKIRVLKANISGNWVEKADEPQAEKVEAKK